MQAPISLAEYYQLGFAQLTNLPENERVNATRSLVIQAPGQYESVKAELEPLLDSSLAYFVVQADGTPTLIVPPPPPPVVTFPGQQTASPNGAGVTAPPGAPAATVTPVAQPSGASAVTAGVPTGISTLIPGLGLPISPASTPPAPSSLTGTPTATGSVPGTLDAQGNVVCPEGYLPAPESRLVGGAQDLTSQVSSLLTSAAAPSGGVEPSTTQAFNGVTWPPGPCLQNPSLFLTTPLTKNDILHVDVINGSASGQTVTVLVRIFGCDGQIHLNSLTLKVQGVQRPTSFNGSACLPLTDGFLLSVGAMSVGVPCLPGELWVQAYISTEQCSVNASTANTTSLVLFADYLAVGNPLGWPNGRIRAPGEGPGSDTGINFGNATWGSLTYQGSITFDPNTNTLVRIKQFSVKLTTTATAGNRYLTMQLQPQKGPVVNFAPPATQPPSTTYLWTWATGIASGLVANGNVVQIPIPDNIFMTDQDQIQILGTNMDNADTVNYSGPLYKSWAGVFE